MGDNDFPAVMANWGDAQDLASKWKSRSAGSSTSISGGLGLPTTADHAEFVAGDASDEDPWFVGEKKVL